MKTALKAHLFSLALLVTSVSANAQSTAFTYHGRLNQNGVPVTGLYDLEFTLFDSSGGAGVIAGPLPANGFGVTNGLFTIRLEFGAGVFTGPARWLEIRVRPAGSGNFETLSPRQELTSSPYAIRAQTAGTATDVSDGSVVKSLNNLKDNVTLAAGANVTLTPNGNTLTIGSTASGGSNSIWSLNGADAYYNGGNVGLGTTTPHHRLRISGGPLWTANGWGGAVEMDNSAAIAWRANSAGHRFGIGHTDGGLFFLSSDSDPGTAGSPAAYAMIISDSSNVGIGTTTPATKLTVRTSALGSYGIEHTDGNVRLSSYVSSSGGWLGTRSSHPLFFYVSDGVAPSLTIDTDGDLGLGTTTPQERLTIANVFGPSSGLKVTGVGVAGVGMALENLFSGGHKWALVSGDAFNPLVPSLTGNFRIVDETANATRFVIAPDGNVGIGNLATPGAKLDVQGTTRTTSITITGGADLAEPFPFSSTNIVKGSVVIIDDEHPGKLKLSTRAFDTRVAGIVSGANGVKPGITLSQKGLMEGDQNVALSGRVYVKSDATLGTIKPGDLLTTSDTPGHAMKVTDPAKAQGAILGKAMSGLKEGKGMVLVLVTLQ